MTVKYLIDEADKKAWILPMREIIREVIPMVPLILMNVPYETE